LVDTQAGLSGASIFKTLERERGACLNKSSRDHGARVAYRWGRMGRGSFSTLGALPKKRNGKGKCEGRRQTNWTLLRRSKKRDKLYVRPKNVGEGYKNTFQVSSSRFGLPRGGREQVGAGYRFSCSEYLHDVGVLDWRF